MVDRIARSEDISQTSQPDQHEDGKFSSSDNLSVQNLNKSGFEFWVISGLVLVMLVGTAVGITLLALNVYMEPVTLIPTTALGESTVLMTEKITEFTESETSTQQSTSLSVGTTTELTEQISTTATTEIETSSISNIQDNLISRDEWLAEPSKEEIKQLNLPIRRIIIAHTADEDNTCLSKDDCKSRVKQIQAVNSDLKDIPFNFLIGGDGNVYEGRGFELEGEHTSNVNATSYNDIGICIAFIGTFDIQQPSAIHVEAFHQFIYYFIQEGIIMDDYKIFLQDQLAPQTISANGLLQTIESWSNFHSVSRIYRRHEWRAFSKCRDSPMLPIPMDRLMLTHTVQRLCTTLADCGQLIQNLQYGMIGQCLPDSYNDIGFGFIIGGDGYVFEGLGFDVQGAHTSGYNSATIGIAFIGDFSEIPPNDAIVEATLRFFDDGMALGKLSDDYRVNARVDFSTAGPGEAFMKIIRTWPRYSKV